MRVLNHNELANVSGGQSPLEATGARILEFNSLFAYSEGIANGFWGADTSLFTTDWLNTQPASSDLGSWWRRMCEGLGKFLSHNDDRGEKFALDCAKQNKTIKYTQTSSGPFNASQLQCVPQEQ